jgi:NAD(P)-dependent dehydrogenase (short-subunit alcohol dehydrogenase family)
MKLQGRTALIAGAGRNNGKAIALQFAREGAELILVARQLGDELNSVAQECEKLGAKVLPLLADVSRAEDVDRIVEQGIERYGKIDNLVCAVGIRPHKKIWEYSYEEWHRIFDVNVHSAFYLAKAVAPHMMKRRTGNIIALGGASSLTAMAPSTGGSEVAAKHSLYGIIKSIAYELGPYGIRANHLILSFIENKRRNIEWYPTAVNGDPFSRAEVERSPLGRRGTPEEVAKAALFLGCDDSSYITGDRICCMGGRYM